MKIQKVKSAGLCYGEKAVCFSIIFFLLFGMLLLNQVRAQTPPTVDEIGIDEHLGKYIPRDIEFFDENSVQIQLHDLVDDKPFVLAFVYYECPGICGPLMNGLAEVLDDISLEPGKDFHVITISIDPSEKPVLARDKKKNFYKSMKRSIPEDAWYFLTGTQENIDKMTKAVGFKYQKLGDGTYAHTGAITSVSPKGMIARYLYGITYLPFDLQMALVEASNGKVGPTINKLLRYCFSYEPKGRKYAFNILRVAGVTSSLVGLGFLGFVLVLTKKRRKTENRGES